MERPQINIRKQTRIPMPTADQLRNADTDVLVQAVLAKTVRMFTSVKRLIIDRHRIGPLEIAAASEAERALLAAACELYDLVAKTPQGREALQHFNLEPFPEDVKGE